MTNQEILDRLETVNSFLYGQIVFLLLDNAVVEAMFDLKKEFSTEKEVKNEQAKTK